MNRGWNEEFPVDALYWNLNASVDVEMRENFVENYRSLERYQKIVSVSAVNCCL